MDVVGLQCVFKQSSWKYLFLVLNSQPLFRISALLMLKILVADQQIGIYTYIPTPFLLCIQMLLGLVIGPTKVKGTLNSY